MPSALAQGWQLLRGDGERDHHRRRRPGQVQAQRPVGGDFARTPQDIQARNQVVPRSRIKILQELVFRKKVTFHSLFAAVRRRARRARSSRNASVSMQSGGSRRNWSASRTSRRRARRERTSGRTSATRQDWRPTLGVHVHNS